MHDPFTVNFDRSKLSPWYFSVSWARLMLEHKIQQYKEWGFTTKYDEAQLERLVDLEQFLKMSWDQWMDSIETRQAAKEVK